MPGFRRIDGEPGGDAVVADKPQGNGDQKEGQAPLHIRRQDLPGLGDGGQVVLRVGFLVLFLLRYQLRLVDAEHDDGQRHKHDAAHNSEQGQVGDIDIGGGLIQEGGDDQVNDAAQSAHQVDDGIGLGAQGLGGHVGHQCHGGRTVSTHGDKQQP